MIDLCFTRVLEHFVLLRLCPKQTIELEGHLAISLARRIGVFDDNFAVVIVIDLNEVGDFGLIFHRPCPNEYTNIGASSIDRSIVRGDLMCHFP